MVSINAFRSCLSNPSLHFAVRAIMACTGIALLSQAREVRAFDILGYRNLLQGNPIAY